MILETERFGKLTIQEDDILSIPTGILGFPEDREFCLVDPGDEILILWLQSLRNPNLAFPVLEPKIFKPDYYVRLSGVDLRELQLENLTGAAVLSILTIPENVNQMTANLKAPLVIHLKERIARQVVLQENEFPIQHPMFKELKTQLMFIRSQNRKVEIERSQEVLSLHKLPPSNMILSASA